MHCSVSRAQSSSSCQPFFLCRSEELARDVVVVRELLTGWQGMLPVSGSGSADERVINN